MNWFVAHIVFRVLSGGGDHTPQFDEQLKLISARSEASAFKKAVLLGQQGQDSFPNNSGHKVEWKFVGIKELEKIKDMVDGVEIASRIIEADHGDLYMHFILQKNHDIESRLISLKTQHN
jgi:hypothetical protein